MTIASKLTYLAETKQLLKDAINAAGGGITNNTTFREYPKFLREQGATLDLQFWCERFISRKQGSMTPNAIGFNNIVTFTRASTGGVFNEYGQYVQRAVNEWRNDHDPATLTTSTSTASFDSNTATFTLPTGHAFFVGDLFRATAVSGSLWGVVTARTATSVTVYVRNTTGNGSASSWTCIKPLGILIEEQRTNLLLNSATLATQSRTLTATAHTLSFYGTGSVTLSGAATGTLVGTGASTKVSLTFTPSAGSLTLTVSGSVTSGQLEPGSFATSTIPTEASQVTRAADVCSVNTLSPWYNQADGAVVISCTPGERGAGTYGAAAGLFSLGGDVNNRLHAYRLSGNIEFQLRVSGGSTAQNTISFTGSKVLAAMGWASGALTSSVNGETRSTASSAPPPSNILTIGRIGNGNYMNGHIHFAQYFPRGDIPLQGLTA